MSEPNVVRHPNWRSEPYAESSPGDESEPEYLSKPVNDERTRSQRAADVVTAFCGSWTFIFVFALFTVGWIALNTIQVAFAPWDKYPFILLNLVFTVIELFQGPLILLSEHRQMERDREAVQGLHRKLDTILEKL